VTATEGGRASDRNAADPNQIARVCCCLVAGARSVADLEQLPIVTAHWRYQRVKHAERRMVRLARMGELLEGTERDWVHLPSQASLAARRHQRW
jgi:hypothetical protein